MTDLSSQRNPSAAANASANRANHQPIDQPTHHADAQPANRLVDDQWLSRLPLLVTTGEPAGIGMDIVLKLAYNNQLSQLNRPVLVLADAAALRDRWSILRLQWQACDVPNDPRDSKHSNNFADIEGFNDTDAANDPSSDRVPHQLTWHTLPIKTAAMMTAKMPLSDAANDASDHIKQAMSHSRAHTKRPPDFYVLDVPCQNTVQAGVLDTANADMVMQQLLLAHHLAHTKAVSAVVTAPLQKSVLIDAGCTLADGSMFTGHTEFFMQQCKVDKVVMMLANTKMKVALVTTHLPLRAVADAITPKNVRRTVQIVLDDLQHKFAICQPKILVCGLNPHAGEGGHLGQEEASVIDPVLSEFQKRGVDISMSMPADTLFTTKHLSHCDAVIAMYHDQGLPVLKSHGFGDTVNLTLGLPYVRTSVDHGTALDLAGSGQASASSLWQALLTAESMTTQQS